MKHLLHRILWLMTAAIIVMQPALAAGTSCCSSHPSNVTAVSTSPCHHPTQKQLTTLPCHQHPATVTQPSLSSALRDNPCHCAIHPTPQTWSTLDLSQDVTRFLLHVEERPIVLAGGLLSDSGWKIDPNSLYRHFYPDKSHAYMEQYRLLI